MIGTFIFITICFNISMYVHQRSERKKIFEFAVNCNSIIYFQIYYYQSLFHFVLCMFFVFVLQSIYLVLLSHVFSFYLVAEQSLNYIFIFLFHHLIFLYTISFFRTYRSYLFLFSVVAYYSTCNDLNRRKLLYFKTIGDVLSTATVSFV